MDIDPVGWLETVECCPSPNADARPDSADISLVVVHGISLPPGQFGGPWIDDLFANRLDPDAHPYFREICDFRVSAHLLIRREGALIQYVPFSQRAWHAGPSEFEGRPACNDFSIGIELEGADDVAYTPAQYRALGQVCHAICNHYPGVTRERIVGHSDIAPGRKTDPGPAFRWDELNVAFDEAGAAHLV